MFERFNEVIAQKGCSTFILIGNKLVLLEENGGSFCIAGKSAAN